MAVGSCFAGNWTVLFVDMKDAVEAIYRNDLLTLYLYMESEYDGFDRITDSKKNTLLHHAAESGYFDMVDVLLLEGANPNVHNVFGETPLHVAEKKGFEDAVLRILQSPKTFIWMTEIYDEYLLRRLQRNPKYKSIIERRMEEAY